MFSKLYLIFFKFTFSITMISKLRKKSKCSNTKKKLSILSKTTNEINHLRVNALPFIIHCKFFVLLRALKRANMQLKTVRQKLFVIWICLFNCKITTKKIGANLVNVFFIAEPVTTTKKFFSFRVLSKINLLRTTSVGREK